MNSPSDRILAEAMKLPEQERAELATELIESLGSPFEPNVDKAWREEIRRRIESMDRGEVKGIPWSVARRQILGERDDSAAA